MMTYPPAPPVAGHRLDGDGTYVIDKAENAALCRSTGVEPATDGTAHPAYYYIATQVAMGQTVAGLCALCDFDIEQGPMMASSRVDFQDALRTGVAYRVTGEIIGLTRKPSRKLGLMDMLEYRLRLHGPDGTVVLEATNVWVLPRRELLS
ncbi:hypothetical protein [Niveispirillum fermenti]|uniref:hypothetical protein n=1 Tax=Niveispirillum fermenti TaxID=1233113 RepID=UPI003A87393A